VSVLLMFLVSLSVQAFVGEEGSDLYHLMATSVAALMVTLILLIGPAITGGTICADRESGVWDLIRSTPLPSWRVVSGKFQASVIPLLLLALAMVPALVILLYFDKNMWPNVLRILAVVGMTILFVATAGTFFSSMFSRTSTATAWTYSVVIVMGLLTMLVLLAKALFSDRLIGAIFVLNPVAAAMDAAGHGGMQKYGLMLPHLRVMAVATAVLFVITVVRVFQLRQRD